MKKLNFHGDAIITGRNSIQCLRNRNYKRAFIVTGEHSMFQNGTMHKIKGIFKEKGSEIFVHAGVPRNPNTFSVMNGVEHMKKFKPDVVIAVGGGSSIDAAKVMTLLYEYPEINFGNILSMAMPEKRKNIVFVAIPSTSGTGTEITDVAVITFEEKKLKISIRGGSLTPDFAILDPLITMSMPESIVAETGMDALTHAVECYTNRNLDDFTESIAREAVEGIIKYLPLSYRNNDIENRERIHNLQCIAGFAFAEAGLGMVHGISHALGGCYNLGHGFINAIILPYVLQYNSRDSFVRERLSYLSMAIGGTDIVQAVKDMKKALNIPVSIEKAGIKEEYFKRDLELLADNSMLGATRVNPVSISRDEMKAVLINMYKGIDLC